MKNKYNKSSKQYSKSNKNTITAKQTKEVLKRLAKPNKILAEQANNKGDLQNQTVEIQPEALQQLRNEQVFNQPMENTDSTEQENTQETVATTPEIKEPENNTEINLADSGFFEPVIERAYAEQPQTQVVEPPKVEPVQEPVKPMVIFAPKLILKTDDTYKKAMGDETAENPEPADPADSIPSMQFEQATNFDLSDNADSLGRQIGQETGNTTSEWAFGMLENFYPEVVAFFTKIPTEWIEKAKLPNALETEMLQKILAANTRNKNKVKISDFHKKNILPPLKRILEKKGWENVMPDELLLIIGLVVLAADSFFKIGEIKKENKVMEKQIKQKVQEYIDIRTEERKEIDSLKGQLGEMSAFMKQFQAMQQAGQPAAA